MNVEEFINEKNLYAEPFEKIAEMYMDYKEYKKNKNKLKNFIIFEIDRYAQKNKDLFLVAGSEEELE